MTSAPNPSDALPRHTLTYKIMTNLENEDQTRTFEIYASPEEIEHFGKQGYLVRKGLFSDERLQRYRTALDEIEAKEAIKENVGRSRTFGGWFPRYLFDKHAAFHDLIDFAPFVSVARAMLGPFVRIRQLGGRVAYPGEPNQETHWHLHRRTVPDPLPAFFSFPHTLDYLIYLDELNEANGPLAYVPGSHLRIHEDLPANDFSDKAGQEVLYGPPGTVLMIHSNLWHRAWPTRPDGQKRRLLILSYGATWMRKSPYGIEPATSLLDDYRANASPAVQELLGIGGYQ
ncbi:MAG: phytanoyl-CoA dioxygenase family protein [Caldilineaceae bacterium]